MINHVGTKTLETKRLILRRYELSDAQDMFNNFANNKNVTRFLSWYPHENVEVTKELLISWVEAYKNENRYMWAIVLKEINQVIGSISVVGMSEKHQTAELGYSIGEAFWGKGITTEAVEAVISFLFHEVGFHRIQAKHDTENPASGRVMEKAGMKFEGTMRHERIHKDGSRGDTSIWAIIRDE